MSATFITVTLDDDAGQVIVNVCDISSIGPAHGDANGARLVLRQGRALDVQDSYEHLRDVLRSSGVLEPAP